MQFNVDDEPEIDNHPDDRCDIPSIELCWRLKQTHSIHWCDANV